ncbi:hypothetical protein PCASD_18457 [Puccinia coronata f. sp. avenae]|uniref:Uncharacterized protein n=1 Tax=Puccinia coronata f. sp. avenae TaxID=200324 RepID=A0A2N5U2T5_9BASI|nr:hypothetical protein PCASD_18457 [Puccinia coronata f. sp. avenae]
MVLYEYNLLIDSLESLKAASKDGVLEDMFGPMIEVANKYKSIALKCKPILMATVLHPAWRLLLFANKINSHHSIAQGLLVNKFKERQALLKPTTPPPDKEDLAPVETNPCKAGYVFYSKISGQDNSKDELTRYHNAKYTLGIKGDVLSWWKGYLHWASQDVWGSRVGISVLLALATITAFGSLFSLLLVLARLIEVVSALCFPGLFLAASVIAFVPTSRRQRGVWLILVPLVSALVPFPTIVVSTNCVWAGSPPVRVDVLLGAALNVGDLLILSLFS